MKEISKFFAPKPAIPLSHYTGIASVLGMARTEVFWASNPYYLNDTQEVVHACGVLRQQLSILLQTLPKDHEMSEFLWQLQRWAKNFTDTHYNIFIFSLSEQPNLLSQWRSYTPHGKGVSLMFEPSQLENIAGKADCVLAKCLYQVHEHKALIHTLIAMICDTFRQRRESIDVSKEHPDNRYFRFLEEFRGDFLRALCIIKHPAFAEEQEWRLISRYFPNFHDEKICLREGASMLVPYIELPFPDERPVFREILLGPSEHQNLAMSALSMLVSRHQLSGLTRNTQTPYREWRRG